jgi:hypothetical protein
MGIRHTSPSELKDDASRLMDDLFICINMGIEELVEKYPECFASTGPLPDCQYIDHVITRP